MRALDPAGFARNELAVLNVIRARGQATRTDVAETLGLSVAMAARLVARLQQQGVVREMGRETSSGPGRQASMLDIVPDLAFVVGVDIGAETLGFLVADLRASERSYQEFPATRLAGLSQMEIVTVLAQMIDEVIVAAGVPPTMVAAVGVAIAGIIDSERGMCLARSSTPGWERFPIAARLQTLLRRPVVLEEMARAKSVAELALGAARGAQHFLYVEVGANIGASLVIDGRPFRGAQGLAGELGHVTVDPEGPVCRCGNRGCIQASASANALVAQARELLHRGVYSVLSGREEVLSFSDIATAANTGDKMALGLLTTAGERLGEALSMALNLLGVDLVVLGGRVVQCSPVVLAAAERIVRLRVLPIVSHDRVLIRATLGTSAGARGVVVQALDSLFARRLSPEWGAETPKNGQEGPDQLVIRPLAVRR